MIHRMLSLPTLVLLTVAVSTAVAAEKAATRPAAPQSPAHTERLLRQVARCDAILKDDPKNVDALQARAEANFRLGRIGPSVEDFDKVVALEPASLPHNWQRGIALYYAGRLEDAVKQFERHREVNPQDVENATWHFLCLARSLGPKDGPAAARKQFIPIEADSRIPLMTVHAMYAGKATEDDVLKAAQAGEPSAEALRVRLFYAHLYVALYHEAQGDSAKAKEHMALAAGKYSIEGYMGDVARVHAWRMEQGRPPADDARD